MHAANVKRKQVDKMKIPIPGKCFMEKIYHKSAMLENPIANPQTGFILFMEDI